MKVSPTVIVFLSHPDVRTADFENQGAHHIAKQHDPEGKRTIGTFISAFLEGMGRPFTGVLTKPDRIAPGEEEYWLRFIRNDAEPLSNGWFTVRQPATKDLKGGITWEEARDQERVFFTSNLPWSSAETYCQKRFGTQNLTESLNKILSYLIKRRCVCDWQHAVIHA